MDPTTLQAIEIFIGVLLVVSIWAQGWLYYRSLLWLERGWLRQRRWLAEELQRHSQRPQSLRPPAVDLAGNLVIEERWRGNGASFHGEIVLASAYLDEGED